MGCADDDKVAKQARTPPVDPALLARPDVRIALASHGIRTFYRVLGENGWTQREIAKATGTQQSGVSEILRGRQVVDYRVLVRIADGLGIPRELMNLSDGAYPGGVTATDLPEEVSAEMRRRVATIHVRAGEPGGLQRAHSAITGVTKLSSIRARQRLEPLVAALETRPGSDYREVARIARQVAATRA